MVARTIEISAETQQILEIINRGENFLLSGGAGSGKTYSLKETIREVLRQKPREKIACITYTNAAVREITVDHKNLHVSTIHDFLWDNIKHYQVDLRKALLELIVDEDDEFKRFKLPEGVEVSENLFDQLCDGIQYKEYVRLKDGIISHDELLVLAWKMYASHPKLCGITKDKFSYIFVDEYQDTSRYVVEILLDHFPASPKKCVVGFFGDAMQSIYQDGVGDIDAYKGDGEGQVREVKKEQNRRNPRLVIEMANQLRSDGLTQRPSEDESAPNMQDGVVKDGCIQFLYSNSDNLDLVRSYLAWEGSAKELNLTHNLIAGKAGFRQLMDVYDGDKILAYAKRIKARIKSDGIADDFSEYTFAQVIEQLKEGRSGGELKKVEATPPMKVYIEAHGDVYQMALGLPYEELASIYIDKDQLLDDKKDEASDASRPNSQRDDLIKHLFKIQQNIYFYQNGMVNEFLRATDFKITSVADMVELKRVIDLLVNVGDKTVEQIIEEADDNQICKIDDRLAQFQKDKRYVYEQVKNLPFAQFQKLYQYLEGHTPFSTQHKTKGREYPNVLVILDNGRWNDYDFEYLFDEENIQTALIEGKSKTKSKLESFPRKLNRTKKIFYVCCTRAKENLAVFYHQPSGSILTKALEWFGEENVVNLDD